MFLQIYTRYYPVREEADLFKYFDDGAQLHSIAAISGSDYFALLTGTGNSAQLTSEYLGDSHFWDKSPSLPFLNENRSMIRLNSIIYFISGGNVYLHVLLAISASFTGLILLFLALKGQDLIRGKVLFAIVFFTPSLLFWTSSMLKESFAILGFGWMLYTLWKGRWDWKEWTALVLSTTILMMTRFYLLLVLLPPLLSYQWENGRNDGKILWRYASVNLFFLSLVVASSLLHGGGNILKVLSQKQADFICLAEWMGAGSKVHIPALDGEISSFLAAAPFALWNTLFRPLPVEAGSLITAAASAEITAIVLLWVFSIPGIPKTVKSRANFVAFSINFIFIMALLIGWTTPVSGAIVRHRIFILPFLIVIPVMVFGIKKFPFLSEPKKTAD